MVLGHLGGSQDNLLIRAVPPKGRVCLCFSQGHTDIIKVKGLLNPSYFQPKNPKGRNKKFFFPFKVQMVPDLKWFHHLGFLTLNGVITRSGETVL